MVSEILLNKMLNDTIAIMAAAKTEEEAERKFSELLASAFGIDDVSFNNVYKKPEKPRQVDEYIANTKKPVVDNQLSEYSSFTELVRYGAVGFGSCALIPITANNEVMIVIQLLSKTPGKFTEELVNGIVLGAFVMGYALIYRTEKARSLRLANYFDAAFNSNVPQFLVGRNGRIALLNKAAISSFKTGVQNGPISDALRLGEEELRALTKGTTANITVRADEYDTRIYNIAASAINEELMHVSARDLTELFQLKTLSEAITATEELCVLETTPNMIILNTTDNFEAVFRCDPNLLMGKSLLDFVPERERNDFLGSSAAAGAGKGAARGKLSLVLAEKEPSHVRYSMACSQAGYLILLASAEIEKHIEDLEENYNEFIKETSDVVLVFEGSGQIRDSNISIEKTLGYNKGELAGKDVRSMYTHPEVLDKDVLLLRTSGQVSNSYVELLKKDGTPIRATQSLRLLKNADGTTDYVLLIKELETKELLDELKKGLDTANESLRRLKKQSGLKSEFIYNISHELKTPLTSIKGFSALLYRGEFGQLNEEQSGYVHTIQEEADRLMEIIQQILDASKLEAEKVKLELCEVDLRDMRDKEGIKSLEKLIRDKGLDFSWGVDFNVPKITADPNRLVQVFVNLIGNAYKFTDHGSIKVQVKRTGKRVTCIITDTGIGIADEAKSRIFKKFYMAPKKELKRQDGAGTGLGLAITRDIIRLHRGKVGFESQLGKGTTFTFTLPIKPPPPRKEKDRQPQQQGSAANGG